MSVASLSRMDALASLRGNGPLERFPTLRDAIAEFLAELRLQDRTACARTYRSRLAPIAALELHTHELNRATCLRVAGELGRTLRPESLRTTIYAWRAFSSWCIDRGYAHVRFADVPKPARRPPKHRWLSAGHLRALFAACRNDTDRLVLQLLATTGLRNAELCSLEWRDVDLAEGIIRVRGKGSKWRAVAIGEGVVEALLSIPAYNIDGERQCGRVFRFGPEALRYRVKAIGRRAGIAGVHPHLFRHSFAVAFLDASGEDALTLQILLGHASPLLTAYYVRDVRERAAVRKQRAVDLGARLFGDGSTAAPPPA